MFVSLVCCWCLLCLRFLCLDLLLCCVVTVVAANVVGSVARFVVGWYCCLQVNRILAGFRCNFSSMC